MTREFCRGGSGGRRALAGIFDDRAKGVLVAEPREQEVPQRDKRLAALDKNVRAPEKCEMRPALRRTKGSA